MPTQRNRLVPIEWDATVVDLLSEIAPDDVEGAKVWWELYAPALYVGILDAVAVGDSSGIRDTDDIREWVEDNQDLTAAQVDWKKAGLLFVFLGGSYYTIKGLVVSSALLRTSLTRALNFSNFQTQGLCDQLRKGSMSLRQWQMDMKGGIVSSQLAAGILAAGGVDSFTPSHMLAVERSIAFQLDHLANLASRIAGGMKLDGTICRLMKMYVNSARGAFYAVDGIMRAGMGYTLYANVLGAGEEHCTGGGSCPEVTAQGYQPVGSLTPIGARNCMSNCLCHWTYMNPVTGETW